MRHLKKSEESSTSIQIIQEDMSCWVGSISNKDVTQRRSRSYRKPCPSEVIAGLSAASDMLTEFPESGPKPRACSKKSKQNMKDMKRSARTSLPCTLVWETRITFLPGLKRIFRAALARCPESDGCCSLSQFATIRAMPICCVEWGCSRECSKAVRFLIL